MTQENHRDGQRLPQHEACYCNSSQVYLSEYCRGMYGQHTERLQKRRRRKKQETKPITNTKLYWRESLVGNGITRAFNWMEVTFAEQGVAAFVSARRHKLLPYTCITLHWVGRGRRENSQSHSAEFSLTSQLMGGLWRHRGAARGEKKKINTCDQSTCMCSTASFWRHSWLSTTHKCQQNHESI